MNLPTPSRLARGCLIAVLCILLIVVLGAFWRESKAPEIALTGGCGQERLNALQRRATDAHRITTCGAEDSASRRIASAFAPASARIVFRYAGMPAQPGMHVFLESGGGSRFPLKLEDVGPTWRQADVPIPPPLRAQSVRLVVESPPGPAWVGIGEVRMGGPFNPGGLLLMLACLATLHIALSAGLAAVMRDRPHEDAIVLFMVVLGLAGWAAFWVYYARPSLGLAFSFAAALFIAATLWKAGPRQAWNRLVLSHRLLLPASAYAGFILVVGYFPSFQVNEWLTTAASRWMNLPPDNILPRLFAEQILRGHVQKPMFGDWLSSDRPPLQTGIYLLLFGKIHAPLAYQVLASLLQALVLLPAALLLRRVAPRLRGWGLVTLGASSLLSVHTLFVWPKLLATSYVLIAYLLTLESVPALALRPRAVLAGLSAALAMLSHGGAVFGLLAIALIFAAVRLRETLRLAPAAVAAAALSYLPWMAYQRFLDPPGNRLLKWHLAGMIPPNDLSVSRALATAYAGLSWQDWLAYRLRNLEHLFGGSLRFWHDLATGLATAGPPAAGPLVGGSFFDMFYSLWALSPVTVVCVWLASGSWRRGWPKEANRLLASAIASSVVSALLLFSPDGAVVHQISLFSWIAFFGISAAFLVRLPTSLAIALTGLNTVIFALAYVVGGSPAAESASGSVYYLMCALGFTVFTGACVAGTSADKSSPQVPDSR